MSEEGVAAFVAVAQPMADHKAQLHQQGETRAIVNSVTSTARPPRIPKPSSQALPEKISSSQPNRSSSQPRASLSKDPNRAVPSRSMSQPRSSQSHFLQGFNVADCFDVRSIPDPPSPIAPSRPNRRRLSTPIMLSSPSCTPGSRGLGDVTNSQGSDAATRKKISSSKKRKSLIHVPAPVRYEDVLHGQDIARAEDKQMEDQPPKTLQVNICLEEEEVEETRISPKRRRKRQSMVLPTPMDLSEEGSALSSPSRATTHTSSPRTPGLSPEKPFPGTLESMEELRSLVRGYCAMSGAEKLSTIAADRIRALTGYPMPGGIVTKPTAQKKVETDQKIIIANRRRVFSKIAPAMAIMEKQKEHDTKQWELDTGCRVGKSSKSGKYRYFSIEDNQRMASQEYKRRYMAVLEGARLNRAAIAQKWMEKLAKVDPDVDVPIAPTEVSSDRLVMDGNTEALRTVSHDVAADGLENESDMVLTQDQEVEQLQREAFLPPKSNLVRRESSGSNSDDAMELCDLTVSLNRGELPSLAHSAPATITSSSDVAEISEASSEDTEESGSRTATPSPLPLEFVASSHAEVMQGPGPVLVAQSRDEGMDEHCDAGRKMESAEVHDTVPLLPLPSREAESLDPDIAQAEKRLWDKIDAALKEYSEEVMKIRKAKHGGVGEPRQPMSFTL
jgi:hypothetical protein